MRKKREKQKEKQTEKYRHDGERQKDRTDRTDIKNSNWALISAESQTIPVSSIKCMYPT
jgi:hypothetical protein